MYHDTWTERGKEFLEGFKMKNPTDTNASPESAAPAGGATAGTRTLASELHALAMNTPTDKAKVPNGDAVRMGYLCGHRDARHAIAEALIGHPALQAPAAVAAEGAERRSGWMQVHEQIYAAEQRAAAAESALAAAEKERDRLQRLVDLALKVIEGPEARAALAGTGGNAGE